MAICFRADASDLIGNGHVMRCLALAAVLKARGETCRFVCRELTGLARDAIATGGHELALLPASSGKNTRSMPHARWLAATWQDDAESTALATAGARWIVADHYGIDSPWESALRRDGRRVAIIDDLADREHDCDLLLDVNLQSGTADKYANLAPRHVQKLYGPRYALLRPEFSLEHEPRRFDGGTTRILVAFSGADPLHLTLTSLQALAGQVDVTVVAGAQNSDITVLRALCTERGWTLLSEARDMARLMQRADIGIGAGGGMLWERAAMGLSSLAIIAADNQRQQVREAAAAGLVLGLEGGAAGRSEIRTALQGLLQDAAARQRMSETCSRTVDGRGCERVADRLCPSAIALRKARADDARSIWEWRNHPSIRRFSGNADPITWEVHSAWFEKALANSKMHLLLTEDQQGHLGVVRFDLDDEAATVSIYLVPARLGQGRGAALLLAAEDWLAKAIPHSLTLRATVLAGNAASEELFRSCGYTAETGLFIKPLERSS